MTGLPGYPSRLASRVKHEQLPYAGNNSATFLLNNVHVELTTQWEYEAPQGGGDTHTAVAHGTKATVEIRQPSGQKPNLFVTGADPAEHGDLVRALFVKCESLRAKMPGLAVMDLDSEIQILIPEKLRKGHEAHFGAVMEEFVRYFHNPGSVPAWERPNTLAKYFITTKALELAHEK